MKLFAEWYEDGVFVFFPTIVMTWDSGFCGERNYRVELSWIMGSVGVEWTRG